MKKLILAIGSITILLVLSGCTDDSSILLAKPEVKHTDKGLVDTPEEKERIANLINSKVNVHSVFNNIIKQQRKDKYESDIEYKKRMQNIQLNTYAIIDVDFWKKYNPNNKLYTISFSSTDRPSSIAYFYKYGKPSINIDNRFESTPHMGITLALSKKYPLGSCTLTDIRKKRPFTDLQSNAFGVTVPVKHYASTSYKAQLNNYETLYGTKGMRDTYLGTKTQGYWYSIAIPVNKAKAKQLDRQNIIVKARVKLINIDNSMYFDRSGSAATLNSPSAHYSAEYGFDAHLSELVVYNKHTKEILFQFAD